MADCAVRSAKFVIETARPIRVAAVCVDSGCRVVAAARHDERQQYGQAHVERIPLRWSGRVNLTTPAHRRFDPAAQFGHQLIVFGPMDRLAAVVAGDVFGLDVFEEFHAFLARVMRRFLRA